MADFPQAMHLDVGIGILSERQDLAKSWIGRRFVSANPAQVLDDNGQAGTFLDHLLEVRRGKSPRRAEATDGNAQFFSFAPDRQRIAAGRLRGRAEAYPFVPFAHPVRQGLWGVGVVGVDDDHRAEAPRKASDTLHEVAIVKLPSDLN
jgi:hypothetical protein